MSQSRRMLGMPTCLHAALALVAGGGTVGGPSDPSRSAEVGLESERRHHPMGHTIFSPCSDLLLAPFFIYA
jgi:hypothetical protein